MDISLISQRHITAKHLDGLRRRTPKRAYSCDDEMYITNLQPQDGPEDIHTTL